MKTLAKVGLGIVAVGALSCIGLIGGGYALDPHVEIEQTETLSASVDQLQPHLDTYDGVVDWWTTAAEDFPASDSWTIVHVGGPTEGPGLELEFRIGDTTTEHWTLVSSQPGQVEWTVDFQMFVVDRTLTLEETDAGTVMTWHDEGEFTSPLLRWMTLMPPDSQQKNFTMAMKALDRSV